MLSTGFYRVLQGLSGSGTSRTIRNRCRAPGFPLVKVLLPSFVGEPKVTLWDYIGIQDSGNRFKLKVTYSLLVTSYDELQARVGASS